MTATPELDVNEWRNWDQKSKDKLLAMVALAEKDRKVWYCTRGPSCDGLPHGKYDYKHARGDQWPPSDPDWLVWLQRGGRGSGKTRCGSEWIRKMSESIAFTSIIGPTLPHVRDVMVEGESGLLAAFDNAKVNALWEPSKRRITLPGRGRHNEHRIQAFTGEEPDRLRGPNHGAVWLDEPAHYPMIETVWDMMMLGLRYGKRPLVLCTTTPLPIKWLKDLIEEPTTRSVTVSTYANIDNLAPTFRKVILEKYEGTRMGRQELHGEVLEDIEGALWTWEMIENNRPLNTVIRHEDMDRIVVAIDPAGTSSKKRDETGIVVIGRKDESFYVLADHSGHYTPDGWAAEAWRAYDLYQADLIVAEKNYGGEMVLSTLRTKRKDGKVDLVHSRRGKVLRAEPVVGLYEQGRVHHVKILTDLESQMTEWVPDMQDSPDRVDALVHGITKLNDSLAPAELASPGGKTLKGEPLQTVFRNRGGLFGYRPRDTDATPDVDPEATEHGTAGG
jgi:phage terminase large subunit-like protein